MAGSGERAYCGGLSARLTFRARWSAGDGRIPGCAVGGDPSFHKQLCGLLSCASAPLAPWYCLAALDSLSCPLARNGPSCSGTAAAEEREQTQGPLGAAADQQRIPFLHIF